MSARVWSIGIKHYQVSLGVILIIWVLILTLLDIEMVKRKLFSCEANLKSKEEELAQNKNLAILKAKYTRQQLIAKKLAFKVCQSFLENETISSKNLHLFLGQFSGTGAEYLHQQDQLSAAKYSTFATAHQTVHAKNHATKTANT